MPFTVEIPDNKKDKALPAKLYKELPGILSWAVRGAMDWYREGMPPCAAVEGATQEYRSEMDRIQQFADDCLEPDASSALQASVVYACYKAWCAEQGDRYPVGGPKFSGELKKRYPGRKTAAYNEYTGVAFTDAGHRLHRASEAQR